MTGAEAISYIHSVSWLGSKPGLSRTIELLDRLGNPEKSLKFVHVVGSNGKGSTCAMLDSILRSANYKTGLYTSPYLYAFHERMRVNGVPISDEDLAEVTALVRPHADAMDESPTEFELVTAIALLYFQRVGCDIVVLEAGMGGRLDSTNAIPAPEVVAVTRIGLDHTEYLGNTIEAIATEKAGVIKAGSDVVLYEQEPSVTDVFAELCHCKGTSLCTTSFDQISPVSHTLEGQIFHYRHLKDLHIALLGAHQMYNATVAIDTALALCNRGWNIPECAIYEGLSSARWAGRFELLSKEPYFVVDGGHNPQCAQAATEALSTYFPNQKVLFLVGVLADKDYLGMFDQLAPVATGFVTVTPDSPRALSADDLADTLTQRYGLPTRSAPSIEEGIILAKSLVPPHGAICALGSLYMTGAIRAHFGLF